MPDQGGLPRNFSLAVVTCHDPWITMHNVQLQSWFNVCTRHLFETPQRDSWRQGAVANRRLKKIKELQDTDPARCSMCAKFWRMHSRKGSTGFSDFLEAGNWNCIGQTDQLVRFTARFTKPFETDQIGRVALKLDPVSSKNV